MDKVTTIAVDVAERVFSVYWVDAETGEIGVKMLSRSKFEEWMRTRAPSPVVLEAGGSAHHWGRWLERQGHEVRLIAPQHVRAFVRTNKTDEADARAIWEAAQRPEVEWVAIKSAASQVVLGLHRMRRQLIDMRRMQSNQLRSLFYEFGAVLPVSAKVTAGQLKDWVVQGRMPQLLQASLGKQIRTHHAAEGARAGAQAQDRAAQRERYAGDAADGDTGHWCADGQYAFGGAGRWGQELC